MIDLLPTFLDVAGASYPRKIGDRVLTPLPGRSLVQVLRGSSAGLRTLAWEHEGNSAIRVGEWKAFAEQCMAEYDTNGWTAPDLINPDEVNFFARGRESSG